MIGMTGIGDLLPRENWMLGYVVVWTVKHEKCRELRLFESLLVKDAEAC